MYEIYGYPNGEPTNELLIYHPGNTHALVLSPKLTREVSKGGSLTFTMPRDHPQYDNLQKMSTVVVAKQDGKEIWRGRILNHEADWYNRRVVYCEGALSYFNDSCVTPFNYRGTLKQFLQHLVEAHNSQVSAKMKQFELGTVTAALGDLVVEFGDADKYGVGEDYGSIWDIIDKMVLKTFGGYAYCTFNAETGNNVLNYCDQAVEAQRLVNQKIQYGVNLLDITEKTDTNDLFTRIYPIGNKHTVDTSKWYYKLLWWKDPSQYKHEERYGIMGADAATIKKYLPASGYSYNLKEGWIQNDAAAEKFGIIAKIREQDTDSENETFASGVQDLQQNYAMVTSYTVKAVDLVDAGYTNIGDDPLDRLTFASYAHIISEPHGVDAIMLCTKLVEPFDQPNKKEYSFGMTRRTLTDRQVANLGRTNALEEQASTSANSSEKLMKDLTDYKKSNDEAVADAAKTATNFISFDPQHGLTVGHETLADKKVVITADGISITDGVGSCTIDSGNITFHGIRNKTVALSWLDDSGSGLSSFTAQTIAHDFSSVSAVLLTFESNKGSTWLASGGGGGATSMVIPVNGKTYSIVYPWNTMHRRDVTVYKDKIVFGNGYERTSSYGGTTVVGVWGFELQTPLSDGWSKNDAVCIPRELYEFM